jgi:hypothetical protein
MYFSNLPNRHHSESDILRRHVIGTFNFVDLIGFGHNNAVMLQDNRVAVDADLKHGTINRALLEARYLPQTECCNLVHSSSNRA